MNTQLGWVLLIVFRSAYKYFEKKNGERCNASEEGTVENETPAIYIWD